MQVEGSGAIVTGGSSGLGHATVQALRAAGARVAVLDRRAPPSNSCDFFAPADVSKDEQVQEAIAGIVREFDAVQIVVNCAGTGATATAVGDGATMNARVFRRILDVNVTGTFNVIQFSAEAMTRNEPNGDGERGVFINTASTVAFEGHMGTSAYAASKGGVVAMTLPLAREFGRFGIRVVTIAPGIFETEMFEFAPSQMKAWLRSAVPFPPRMGRPPEYAALVRHIVENPMLNGETIRLDAALRVGTGLEAALGIGSGTPGWLKP